MCGWILLDDISCVCGFCVKIQLLGYTCTKYHSVCEFYSFTCRLVLVCSIWDQFIIFGRNCGIYLWSIYDICVLLIWSVYFCYILTVNTYSVFHISITRLSEMLRVVIWCWAWHEVNCCLSISFRQSMCLRIWPVEAYATRS